MTEAQTEYIITEDELGDLEDYAEKQMDVAALVIGSNVRSHPAKESSDKVMEDFKKWFEKYCECDEEADAYMVFFKAYHGYIKLRTKER